MDVHAAREKAHAFGAELDLSDLASTLRRAPGEAAMALRLTSSLLARARVAPRRDATRALASVAPSATRTRGVSARPASTPGGGGGSPARRHVRARGGRGASSETAASSPRLVAPPWKEEVLDSHAALGDVCFVLCAPQGPQNCGAVARVMQNFGVYDLRLVNPGPFVLERGDGVERASTSDDENDEANVAPDGANARGGINSGAKLGPDGLGHGDELPPALRPTLKARAAESDEEDASSKTNDDGTSSSDDEYTRAPLCEEAYRFACAADWLLADASRHDSHVDAIKDCTFVMATTARPRGNVPLVTARVAAKMLVEESKARQSRGFVRERTHGLDERRARAGARLCCDSHRGTRLSVSQIVKVHRRHGTDVVESVASRRRFGVRAVHGGGRGGC
jgi:hypothetical protein